MTDNELKDIAYSDQYYSEYVNNANSIEMNVLGTKANPVVFKKKVTKGYSLLLSRAFMSLEHGSTLFNAEDFGAIVNGLANGVKIYIQEHDGEKILLETWKLNRDIRETMFDFDNSFAVGDYIASWSFFNDVGGNGLLLSSESEFRVEISDDLSSLDAFRLKLKGKLFKKII